MKNTAEESNLPGSVQGTGGSHLASPWGLRSLYAVALLLFASSVFNHSFQVGDEGVALVDAWRISQGQVPHRDFFEIIPPGSFFPTALAFLFLGPSVVVARGLTLLYAILMGWACDAVATRFGLGWLTRSAALSFLIPFGVWCWPMPSHHWVATLLQLVAVWALLAGSPPSRGGWRFGALAGLASGYACACLQDQGAYFSLLVAGGLGVWSFREVRARPLLLGWVGGMAAVGAAFSAYLLPRVPPATLWEQWLTFPVSRYNTFLNQGDFWMGWKVVSAFWDGGGFSQFPMYGATLIGLYAFLTLLPFAAALFLAFALKRNWAEPSATLILAAGAVAALGCALHRWSPQNLLFAAPLLLVPVGLGFERALASRRGALRWAARLSLLGFIGLWGVHIWAFVRLCEPERCGTVSAPAGVLRSIRRSEAESLNTVLAALEANAAPGRPVFCERYSALINFLSLRPNPTRFTIWIYPEYNIPSQMEEVIASLRATPRAMVLLMKPLRPSDPLHAFISKEYRRVWDSPFATLYERGPAALPQELE